MQKFDAKQIRVASDLAVSYEAVWQILRMEDVKRAYEDWNGLRVWCRILKRAQSEIGCILMHDSSIDNYIDKANDECSKIEAILRESNSPDRVAELKQDAAELPDERGEL